MENQTNNPYIEEVVTTTIHKYNKAYGDNRLCKCGHPYYRHFDSYEDMDPCGCKYCQCYTFEEITVGTKINVWSIINKNPKVPNYRINVDSEIVRIENDKYFIKMKGIEVELKYRIRFDIMDLPFREHRHPE